MAILRCISPVDGSVYVERTTATASDVQNTLDQSVAAQRRWKNTPLADRQALCSKAVDIFITHKQRIAEQLTWQMGRPITQTPGEVDGFAERARHMIAIAGPALETIRPPEKAGYNRYITREPLGVVLVVAPWNYPYLTSVNTIIPALLTGNSVILKHSAQTPLCAEQLDLAFTEAGLPAGVFQYLHLTHGDTEQLIRSAAIDFVVFTGSVAGGKAVEKAACASMTHIAAGVGLELGGKDPAYVRKDANLQYAIETLADGAFFNSGQSCCAIERIYVEQTLYQPFIEGIAGLVSRYQLGRPDDANTTLGPMVSTAAAKFARQQIREAIAAGASPLVDSSLFALNQAGTPYLAPQVLVNVDHSMRVMREESFAPLVAIMAVTGDAQAIGLMNDSPFGLTASVFTQDEYAAIRIGDQIDTGTWYMNRCDYLDPALAWSGVKNSGRGCTLSSIGFEQFTRPKSYHLKKV